MSVESLLAGGVGLVAYAVSAGVYIELPYGRRVSLAAAFGPAVVALGPGGYELVGTAPLFGGLVVVELAVVALMQRRPIPAVLRVGALSASLLFVFVSGRIGLSLGVSQRVSLIVGVTCGSLVYYAADVLRISGDQSRQWRGLLHTARETLPLAVVMTSAAGLIVLVFPYLGWASFAVMFLPVIAARHEFGRYREAHRTYRQTVGALAGLTEGAGYIPAGHHSRVARLCVEMADELGLPSQTLQELELVGLLHDVGAVSLPEVSDAQHVDPAVLATNSARILEETGHLAKYAPVVVEAAMEVEGASVEARILHVADAYDSLSGSHAERVRELMSRLGGSEREVIDVLSRVIERRSTRP